MFAITEEMREAARKLLTAAKLTPVDHKLLTAIANGKRKRINARWWNEIHQVVAQAKLDKLSRLADPALNDNPHERDLARPNRPGWRKNRLRSSAATTSGASGL